MANRGAASRDAWRTLGGVRYTPAMDELYQLLTARRRPEDNAQLVLERLQGRLSADEQVGDLHADPF